jgi:hypothetical protein
MRGTPQDGRSNHFLVSNSSSIDASKKVFNLDSTTPSRMSVQKRFFKKKQVGDEPII